MKTALLILLFLVTTNPVLAGSTRFSRSPPSGITCETVRAYVSYLVWHRRKRWARANGITPLQERKAMQCLARGD